MLFSPPQLFACGNRARRYEGERKCGEQVPCGEVDRAMLARPRGRSTSFSIFERCLMILPLCTVRARVRVRDGCIRGIHVLPTFTSGSCDTNQPCGAFLARGKSETGG